MMWVIHTPASALYPRAVDSGGGCDECCPCSPFASQDSLGRASMSLIRNIQCQRQAAHTSTSLDKLCDGRDTHLIAPLVQYASDTWWTVWHNDSFAHYDR